MLTRSGWIPIRAEEGCFVNNQLPRYQFPGKSIRTCGFDVKNPIVTETSRWQNDSNPGLTRNEGKDETGGGSPPDDNNAVM